MAVRKIQCPECDAVYKVDESKIPNKTVRSKCKKCGGVIVINGTAPCESQITAPPVGVDMKICPKCKSKTDSKSNECSSCGVFFDRYEALQAKKQKELDEQIRIELQKKETHEKRKKKQPSKSKLPQSSFFDQLSAKLNAAKSSTNFYRNATLTLVGVIALGIITSQVITYFSPTRQSVRAVDAYLEATLTGKGDPNKTVATELLDKKFFNVLDYKFLSLVSITKIPVIERFDHSVWYSQEDRTYDEFIESKKSLYKGMYKNCKITEYENLAWVCSYDCTKATGKKSKTYTDDQVTMMDKFDKYINLYPEDRYKKELSYGIKIETGETENLVKLLYDVTITNKLGTKLFKKYIFIVNESYKGYLLIDFQQQ